jgi:hypothetical protein
MLTFSVMMNWKGMWEEGTDGFDMPGAQEF